MDDLFNWGNDRFVLGRIADKSGNGTLRKKSAREIFEDALFDGDDQEKKEAEEAGFKITERNETETANTTLMGESENEENILDKLNADDEGDDEEDVAAKKSDAEAPKKEEKQEEAP